MTFVALMPAAAAILALNSWRTVVAPMAYAGYPEVAEVTALCSA